MIRVPSKDEVLPLLERVGFDDLAAADRANFLGWGKPLRGVFLLVPTGEREAYLHVAVDPAARGREALEMAREAVRVATGCGLALRGATPIKQPEAVWFAKAAGMREAARDEKYVYTEAGYGR